MEKTILSDGDPGADLRDDPGLVIPPPSSLSLSPTRPLLRRSNPGSSGEGRVVSVGKET